ncbi:MAG TPA: hypothetical protein PKE69_04720 [Pyrinomonadaceae bacterium]|nr:hypothetical protein [Pyrinomonadaceae bacterium]
MRKVSLISILILAFYTSIFSQTSETLLCPTVNITSNFLVVLGEPITFTATIEGNVGDYVPTYVWTVKDGKILEGQGTSSIKVLPEVDQILAAVEIKGLAERCSLTAEDSVIICSPSPYLVAGFSTQSTKINKAELDNLIVELQNNPTAKAFIIEYFAQYTSQKMISEKIRKTRDYLINVKGIDENRFKITTVSLNENQTKFWIIPAGAKFPEP